MGDIAHTLPAVAALRNALPEATFGWIVEERWAELLCAISAARRGPRSAERPLVDYVHTVDTGKWRKALFSTQTWERVAATLSELRANHYDVAVDFQGAIKSALIARWSGAPTIFGFAQPRETAASMFYSRRITAEGMHVIEQNYSLARGIAPELQPVRELIFPMDSAAERSVDGWLAQRELQGFVVLNPGAGWGAKQWPAERYGQLALALAGRGLRCVVNGSGAESALVQKVVAASAGTAEALTGSLGQLIAITRRAGLFVGGDTGPLHLAAAVGTPVVAIFGPTNPARNGPYTANAIVLRDGGSTTSHKRFAKPDAGLLNISVEQVFEAASTLLEKNAVPDGEAQHR
ncbi:MAG: glycosyltransferase family 9 protein [Acidobacteriales bacterium]|nr:glycosyltransferase family 9 protein [Terriglobales bacterium]